MAWPRRIYCANRNIGVYYTDNFVDPAIQPIWATVNTGLGSLDCMEFHLDPFDQANIQYVLTYEPKLYRRQFGGGWTKILDTDDITALLGGTHYNTNMTSFYPDPVNEGRIWAVVYDGGTGVTFVRSDDWGDHWYVTNTPAMGTYYGSDTIRSYDNYLVYSGIWGVVNTIYISDDTGATWNSFSNFATPNSALVIHPLLGDTFYYCKAGSGFTKYEFGVGDTVLSGTEWIEHYDGMMFDPADALHQRILYNGKLFVTADDWANISDSGVIDGGPLSFADWGGAAPLDIDQILVTMGVSLIAGQYHHCGVLEGKGDTTAVGISGTNCNNAPLYADSIPDDIGGVCKSGLAPLRESQGIIYTNAVAMPGYSDTGEERGVPMPGDRGDWDAKNYPLRHANDIDLVTGIHHTLGTDPGQASAGNHTHALDDLSDVTAPAPVDLDVLTWDAGTGQWINATGGAGLGNAITDPVFQVEGALIVTPDVNGVYICPRAGVIIYVYIYCRDPGSASSTIVDVNLNGASIFAGTPANRPTLAWNDADQVARSGVPDTTAVSENDVLSVDIDQIGTGAKDLTVVVSMDIGTVASGDHDHSGAVGSGGQFDADHLLSTGAGDGDVLTSDGAGNSAWEAIPPPPPPSLALDDLTDVNAPAPNDQDALIWDAGAGEWVSQVPPGGADANAIHVNQANEISGIAPKAAPVAGDLIVIEDSENGFIKKSVDIDNLPGGGGAIADHDHSGDAGDGGQFDAQNLLSTGANDGDVLTSDGAGNSAWEVPAGGSGFLDANGVGEVPFGTPPAAPVGGSALLYADYMTSKVTSIPAMVSANSPSGVASASEHYGSQDAWMAMTDAQVGWITNASALPQWIQYQFPVATLIGGYAIRPWYVDTYPGRTPKDWTFRGSNDGANWTTLDTVAGWGTPYVYEFGFFPCRPMTAYAYYRLYITANNGNAYTGIGQIRIFGLTGNMGLCFLDSAGVVHELAILSRYTTGVGI